MQSFLRIFCLAVCIFVGIPLLAGENISELQRRIASLQMTKKTEVTNPAAVSPVSASNEAISNDIEAGSLTPREWKKQKFRSAKGKRKTYSGQSKVNKRLKKSVKKYLGEDPGALSSRESSKEQFLSMVDANWGLPEFGPLNQVPREAPVLYCNTLMDQMERIVIPQVAFNGTSLSEVVTSLNTLAERSMNEQPDSTDHSINFVLLGMAGDIAGAPITLKLKNITLHHLVDYIAKVANLEYDITDDAVIFYPKSMVNDLMETHFFPVSRAVVARLTGKRDLELKDEEQAIKKFLQRAGVNFENIPNSNLAFDGSQIIVTNTARNLQKIANILQKYSEVKQVEIETKFLEVQQGVLDELGVNWNIGNASGTKTFFTTYGSGADGREISNLRSLNQAFSSNSFSRGDGKIVIANDAGNPTSTAVANQAPGVPGQLNLGESTVPLVNFTGLLNSLQYNVMIKALEQHSGSDLMSAPKLTVLSGKTAEIIVAMELRYPTNYGDIKSEVGSGVSISGTTSSAGVTITAGTPRDFSMRNIGVEMRVTPTVEEDGSISLRLEPRVTEFEGFVEYGGMSVAVSPAATVTVPPGFYQPIFSTRQIQTEVNIADGTTVVMGGLTREEVKQVVDKVPILGDIPLIGLLFRSKSETSQKRNLLIFVTAHTVSPFGYKNVSKK